MRHVHSRSKHHRGECDEPYDSCRIFASSPQVKRTRGQSNRHACPTSVVDRVYQGVPALPCQRPEWLHGKHQLHLSCCESYTVSSTKFFQRNPLHCWHCCCCHVQTSLHSNLSHLPFSQEE